MKSVRATWAILAGLAAGCGDDAEPAVQAEAAAPVAEREPAGTLFGLETREHRLYLLSGAAGRRYTVTTKDDEVVATEIDAATLERDFPALHALLHEPLIDAVDAIDY